MWCHLAQTVRKFMVARLITLSCAFQNALKLSSETSLSLKMHSTATLGEERSGPCAAVAAAAAAANHLKNGDCAPPPNHNHHNRPAPTPASVSWKQSERSPLCAAVPPRCAAALRRAAIKAGTATEWGKWTHQSRRRRRGCRSPARPLADAPPKGRLRDLLNPLPPSDAVRKQKKYFWGSF